MVLASTPSQTPAQESPKGPSKATRRPFGRNGGSRSNVKDATAPGERYMWREVGRIDGGGDGRACAAHHSVVFRSRRVVLTLSAVLVGTQAWSPHEATRTGPATPGSGVHIPVLVYHSVAPHHPTQTSLQRQFDVD